MGSLLLHKPNFILYYCLSENAMRYQQLLGWDLLIGKIGVDALPRAVEAIGKVDDGADDDCPENIRSR